MPSKKLSISEIEARAGTVVNGLIGLKTGDGVRVLCAALNLVVARSGTEFPGSIQSGNANFLPRKSGRMLQLDMDLKMKAFIYGLDKLMSVRAMHEKLVEEFGAKRVPSENTLRNYLKRHQEGGGK